MNVVEIERGDSPVILGFPHTGTALPPDVWEKLDENGRLLADTDWHLHTLYSGLLLGATTVRATFHRYVIDANRDPSGASLYPGQNTTGLVPITDFDGKPIWRAGQEPTGDEVAARLAAFHGPYHAALSTEIARVKTIHGAAVLYDCHSIRSHIPFLFEGTLPDFNVGTGAPRTLTKEERPQYLKELGRRDLPGTCCDAIESEVMKVVRAASGYTSVVNGRFKGGWTTRHYGQPEQENVHAIQMEIAQSTYLTTEAPPFAYDERKASALRVHLKTLLARIETEAFDL